ncbi:MAG: RbsD/FucU family protein [Anaerolineae bacterium]|nr:RbsD/FucU family protein [Anaerolineae bacterium]
MLRNGILNPQINSLLARVRHTNLLVISDRGFPYWPMIETVDISLVDGVPTVLQVLEAIRPNFDICEIFMAQEFRDENSPEVQQKFLNSMHGIPVTFEAHVDMKKRVPGAIGLIRTGDITQYANMVLMSGRV